MNRIESALRDGGDSDDSHLAPLDYSDGGGM